MEVVLEKLNCLPLVNGVAFFLTTFLACRTLQTRGEKDCKKADKRPHSFFVSVKNTIINTINKYYYFFL